MSALLIYETRSSNNDLQLLSCFNERSPELIPIYRIHKEIGLLAMRTDLRVQYRGYFGNETVYVKQRFSTARKMEHSCIHDHMTMFECTLFVRGVALLALTSALNMPYSIRLVLQPCDSELLRPLHVCVETILPYGSITLPLIYHSKMKRV